MAVLYTTLGMVVAVAAGGMGFGTWLANPFIVVPLALVLVALAASMFGAFDLQLPSSLTTKLGSVGGAGPLGAFLMGLVSGFVSAPCTGPVLLGLLSYIATASGDGGVTAVLYGGSLLFVYALGMGTIFFAVALGASLFKPGAWMEGVKSVFGIALLVMAFYFLRPLSKELKNFVIHETWGLWIGLAAFAIGLALGAVHRSFHGPTRERMLKGFGVFLATVGACISMNAFLHVELDANWKPVANIAEFEKAVARADEAGRPLLVDFGADWCNPCHELEAKTFSDPDVEVALAEYELVRIDVSKPTEEHEALQRALHAEQLPSVVVYERGELAPELAILQEGGRFAAPSVHVNKFVPPDEFLQELAGGSRAAVRGGCDRSL
jgi:thiol:disulfide interchange protein DsbD